MSHHVKQFGVSLSTKEDQILQEEENKNHHKVTNETERGLCITALLLSPWIIYLSLMTSNSYDPTILSLRLDFTPYVTKIVMLPYHPISASLRISYESCAMSGSST